MRYEIHCIDNLEWLKAKPDNSVDSVVTDPPYGLGKEPDAVHVLRDWIDHGYHEVGGKGFMGKTWDAFVPQPIFWKEVYRVLKPGGHVLSFAGTRTYDWMVMAMRLAGFEIRDQLIWMYGGGFPKSMDISKAIDKQAGAKREVVGSRIADDIRGGKLVNEESKTHIINITTPATSEAAEWEGWGTALSPSHEPIVLARKPIEKGLTVAANVLKWGTGAINVDGCRVEALDGRPLIISRSEESTGIYGNGINGSKHGGTTTKGRWPSNLIHDGSPDIEQLFPQTGAATNAPRNNSDFKSESKGKETAHVTFGHSDNGGSASRYFYCAKPSQYERSLGKLSEAAHPTVKPVALMHHLVTLVTPPNGVCLDPFCGSGTTGVGAMLAGPNIRFVGLEFTSEYIPIIEGRMANWQKYRQFIEPKESDSPAQAKAKAARASLTHGSQQSLFGSPA